MSKRLTGRRRYRTSSTGMIVLQVEVEDSRRSTYVSDDAVRDWRDATVEDITLHQTVNPKEEATVEQVYDETRGEWL